MPFDGRRAGNVAPDPSRDPGVARLLRDGEHDPNLLQRIVAAAAAELERRRRARRAWWEYEARWSRATIPIGIAAAIIALLVSLRFAATAESNVASSIDSAVLEHVITSRVGDAQLTRSAVGIPSDSTLAAAILQ